MTNYENQLLGAVLLDANMLDDVSVQIDDFNSPKNQQLWETILRLRANGDAVDTLSVSDELPALTEYIFSLTSEVVTVSNAEFYAGKVQQQAMRRNIEQVVYTLQNSTKDAPDLLEEARLSLDRIDQRHSIGGLVSIDEIFMKSVEALTESPDYMPSPWSYMNDKIGGFRKGALYIIGGRPGEGKTVVGLQIAYHLAKQGAVCFNTLEMPQKELMHRIFAMAAEVRMGNISNNKVTDEEWLKIRNLHESLNDRLFIADKSGQTLQDVRAYAKAVNRRHPLKAIVVDYLQLMQDFERGRSRYESITAISNGLKSLARDLNVPVIALAQLNRATESRANKEPSMADLRDSGSIEQDADVVMLLSRQAIEGDLENERTKMVIDIAKNRHGQTGAMAFQFQGQFSRIIQLGA